MAIRIIIIGGGVIGLSCAWRLASTGASVTLLDQAACGSGASGAAMGILWPPSPLKSACFQQLHRASLYRFPVFIQELRDASGTAVDYRRCGGMELISSPSQLAAARREVSHVAADATHEKPLPCLTLLSADTVMKNYPALHSAAFGAVLVPSCATVDVAGLVQALRTACIIAGVRIMESCQATGITVDSSDIRSVHTTDGLLHADAVVVAAGCGTPRIHPMLSTHATINPVKGQAILVRCEAIDIDCVIRWQRLFLWQQSDACVAIGATTEFAATDSTACTAAAAEELLATAAAVMPAIAGGHIIKQWTGLRPGTPDRKPYIGAMPGIPGLYVAAGHYKVGVALAPATADIIAELIMAPSSSTVFSPLQPRQGTQPASATATV